MTGGRGEPSPPERGDRWQYYDFWFFGEPEDKPAEVIQVWKGDERIAKSVVGRAWHTASGWGLFLFQKKDRPLPWFLGYYKDVGSMADKLDDVA